MPEGYGGQGLGFQDMLPSFEQVGRSIIGAMSIRANAPDEGNMHTLEMVGTDAQKEEWLRPLVQGEISSGFSMTEPMQGGGSDPKMLKTSAVKDGDEWVINGHKWWTSGGKQSDFLLVMARTDFDAHPYAVTSIILVPTDADGVNIVCNIPHLGGHGIREDSDMPKLSTRTSASSSKTPSVRRVKGSRRPRCVSVAVGSPTACAIRGCPNVHSTSRRRT